MKLLLAKCSEAGQDAHRALYEWRNIPRTNGYSPAQLLFGRRQYTSVPALPEHFNFYDIEKACQAKDSTHRTEKLYHDQHKDFLPELVIGQSVLLQNPKTKLWDLDASVVSIRPDRLSYKVRADGREFFRARRMIRSKPVPSASSPVSDAARDSSLGNQ